MGDTGPVSQCYDVLPLRAEPGTRRPAPLPVHVDDQCPERAADGATMHATRTSAAWIGTRRRGR